MGFFDRFKKKPEPEPKVKAEPKPRVPVKTEKEIATEKGEPYVAILSMQVDPENMHQGAFELDWNDKFVANLIRAGYQGKPDDKDSDIVDRWFQTVCRNIALEVYEQDQADPTNRDMTSDMRVIRSRDLGDGRTEVS